MQQPKVSVSGERGAVRERPLCARAGRSGHVCATELVRRLAEWLGPQYKKRNPNSAPKSNNERRLLLILRESEARPDVMFYDAPGPKRSTVHDGNEVGCAITVREVNVNVNV